MDHTQIGLAGEYYVLAQLTQRDLVATLTLSNTKAVDILVANQDLNKFYKVEVKTMLKKPGYSRLFGDTKFWSWPMNEKHEDRIDDNLYYCFVALQGTDSLPKFFIVPSIDVAIYVKKQHEYWLSTRKNQVKETSMRQFRIPIDDPKGYENNWQVFLR
jgi:hypothetical protein